MNRARRSSTVAVLTATALGLCGCSFSFMTAPPSKACEEGVSMPVADTILSLLFAGVAAVVGSAGKGTAGPAAAAGVGLVGLTATSAGFGYYWSSRCRRERNADFFKLVRERLPPALPEAAEPPTRPQ